MEKNQRLDITISLQAHKITSTNPKLNLFKECNLVYALPITLHVERTKVI